MIDGTCILHAAACEVQRLIGKPLQPQRSREGKPPYDLLIELKTDAVRTSNRRDVLIEPAVEVVPRAGLVPQVMERGSLHALAYEGIGRVRLSLGQFRKAIGERERFGIFAARDVTDP